MLIVAGHLISGDSTGEVCIWDLQFGTLTKTFNQLKADILSLASHEENVYASGVDSRVINLQLNTEDGEWLLSSIYRGQSHDIKALIMLNGNTLLSGGVTTDICVYKLQDGRFKD